MSFEENKEKQFVIRSNHNIIILIIIIVVALSNQEKLQSPTPLQLYIELGRAASNKDHTHHAVHVSHYRYITPQTYHAGRTRRQGAQEAHKHDRRQYRHRVRVVVQIISAEHTFR